MFRFGVSDFLQVVLSGVAMGSIYALMALGFTIIYNALRLINFAQGDMFMLGATFGLTLFVMWRLPFSLAFVLTGLAVAVVGMIIERTVFRPLRRYPVLNLIIATIGISITLRALALIIWGSQALLFPPVFGDKPICVGGLVVMPHYLWIIAIAVAIIALLQAFFTLTLPGKAMRATAQNRDAASLMGINVFRMDALASAISAGLGGLGGVLIAPVFFVTTEMGALAGLKGFAAAVLGGFGTIPGAIVGGLVLGVSESFAATVASTYRDAVAFIILIAVLLWRPSGIMGPKTR
ncbi:MAG: branched-chain amino acid ABC transporter permease [Firmicutes bacterium]|nr:branched-chain amino acid ABC transporter permease [Bacillota bacterium]MDH7494779.1 branched-chain amino acid ABC transporter permease [Bacillota bacterium]